MPWLLILPYVSPFIGPLPAIPSQFEAGSSSAAVPDDAVTFFARFDQPEVNDLGLADFWASGPPYVDFYGFRVLDDCVSLSDDPQLPRQLYAGVSPWSFC